VIFVVVAPTLRHIRSSTLSGRGTEGGGDDDAIDVEVVESHCVEYLAPILYGVAGACRLVLRYASVVLQGRRMG
jgi:hypothetical protein